MKHAIALGKDTDTTACIAGGIVGIRDGIDAKPNMSSEIARVTELYFN